jgi:glutamine synthetase
LLSPDPTCNPYLALALLLAAGLEGIEQKIVPPHELSQNISHMTAQEIFDAGIERLPQNLGDALDAYEADPLIKQTLGEHAFASYRKVKRDEWDAYSREVHSWELDRYLSIY